MSSNKNGPQGRRTPLSLTAGKQNQNQQTTQPPTNKIPQSQSSKVATSSNGNTQTKNDKSVNLKAEPQPQAVAVVVDGKEAASKESSKKQPINVKAEQQTVTVDGRENSPKETAKKQTEEKKAQQTETSKKIENGEEKKSQNGTGATKTNVGGAGAATKDKQQEQKNEKGNTNGNNDGTKKTDKKDRGKDVVEKQEKVKEKEKDKDKDKEKPEKEKKQEAAKVEDAVKTSTNVNLTPTKLSAHEKKTATSPNKNAEKPTPAKSAVQKFASKSPRNTVVTTAIDVDVDIEPLTAEQSPVKSAAVAINRITGINNTPKATSTPDKQKPNKKSPISSSAAPTPVKSSEGLLPIRNYSEISGRRSIRPITDYTPSGFQSNMQYRESYRRINTELDVTSNTNTSMDVTVGSEVPNNSSFSFFGRGRKRDRNSPPSQFTTDLQKDLERSPPKRARLDVYGLLSAVASPLSLLRSRFSKASIQSSTPNKLLAKTAAGEAVDDVQNVSGISIEEEIPCENGISDADEDITVGNEINDNTANKPTLSKDGITEDKLAESKLAEAINAKETDKNNEEEDDIVDIIRVSDTPIFGAVDDPVARTNKRCSVM